MAQTEIAYELMKAAVSGVSKVQTLSYIKNTFNLTEEQLTQVLNLCNFKSKPKQINYKEGFQKTIELQKMRSNETN